MAKGYSFKKLIPLFLVIAVIISYAVYNNYKPREKAENNRTNIEEAAQNPTKAEENKTDKDQPKNNSTSGDDKAQSENNSSEASQGNETDEKPANEEKAAEITAFLEEANFGSTVEIRLNSNSSNNYKYYQFYAGNEAISNVEGIEKNKTTLYPAQEGGTAVKLKVLDENKKVIKTLDIKLKSK